MKALEILKYLDNDSVFSKAVGAKEAIAELEALQYERANMTKTHAMNMKIMDKTISDFKLQLVALQEELSTANEAYLVLFKQYHALQSPKTCDGCKWHDFSGYDPLQKCDICMRGLDDYYQSKDNQ